MAERDMAAALGASLQAEEDSIAQRIARAEQMLGGGQDAPPRKPEHTKVVRDGFSMPAADHALIATIQSTAMQAGFHMSKSEVFRAALRVLSELSAEELQRVYASLERVKPGRPTV
jgi:hypothetical protein